MRAGFVSNVCENGKHPILEDAKEGDLIEFIFAQKENYAMYVGYVREIYGGHLYITPSDPPGLTKVLILSGIREYRIHRNDSN